MEKSYYVRPGSKDGSNVGEFAIASTYDLSPRPHLALASPVTRWSFHAVVQYIQQPRQCCDTIRQMSFISASQRWRR